MKTADTYSNANLMRQFELACFRVAKNGTKKSIEELGVLEAELAKRLGISESELREIQDCT